MKLFIGWDSREIGAYDVALRTLARRSSLEATPLKVENLEAVGLLNRTMDLRGKAYDLTNNAPASTEFAISRFLVPMLAQSGWALFVDCDVLFLCDPIEILKHADPSKAVMVVKHHHEGGGMKMDGVVQTSYGRKNWSSVMLFNCDHPANRRLKLWSVNHEKGRDLHAFCWLADSEIGELPAEWNWLVGVQPKPENPKIAHFTLGGPWFKDWPGAEHDDLWHAEASNG